MILIEKLLLTVEEARQRLGGMGVVQFRERLRNGAIRHVKHGRKYLIPPAALDEYIEKHLVGGEG